MASGEIGQNGQYALNIVVVVKRPVKENAVIPHHIMVEQNALDLAWKVTLAIYTNVQVTSILLFILYRRLMPDICL